jgi:hypothetical protein
MSHFTVLVIHKKNEELEDLLQPYHEYESTGVEDEYVKEFDIIEEVRADYERATDKRLKDPDGNLHEIFNEQGAYKEEFSEETTAPLFGSTQRSLKVPEGWEEVRVPSKDLRTFAEWALYMYGAKWVNLAEDGTVSSVTRRTNPNRKWDWYVVGGRWSPFFRVKETGTGKRGEPGVCVGKHFGDEDGGMWADSLRKGDVDLDFMRKEAATEAGEYWDKVMAIVGHLDDYVPWKKVREEMFPGDIEAARKFSREQRADVLVSTEEARKELGHFVTLEELQCTREEYVRRAEDSACTPFAVLKDGQWYERGEMGWWGVVLNESEATEWNAKCRELLDGLDDDTMLTIVDCHI